MRKIMLAAMLLMIALPAPALAGPRLVFDLAEHDFGPVHEGDVLTYTFTFSNQGDEILVIEEVLAG